MKSRKKDQLIFSEWMRKLEAEIEPFAAQTLRIFAGNGSLDGICLLSPELAQEKREAIAKGMAKISGITVDSAASNKSFCQKIALLPKRKSAKKAEQESDCGYEYFLENLLLYINQASVTRIPFSVLLIQPDYPALSGKESIALTDKIRKDLKREEIFSVYQTRGNRAEEIAAMRIALILPAAGLNKAKRRAEEICQAVPAAKGEAEKKHCLSVGLGVFYAGERITEKDFLLSVEKHLEEAAAVGNCIRWEKESRATKSCQVTAEERAQLFGFLK